MADLFADLPPAQAQAALKALLDTPAAKPPDGVSANLDNPANLNDAVTLTLVLCLTITSIVLFLRLYVKVFIIHSTTFDDYAVLLAWLGQVGMTVPIVLTVKHGGGVNTWNLPLKSFFRMLYFTSIWTTMYAFVILLVKIAILLQYLRLFVPNRQNNKAMFASIYILIGSCFIFYVVTAGFQIGMCNPRKKFWEPGIHPGGHCYNYFASYKASAIFNVVSDFAILFLPMATLWKLKTTRAKKIGITAIFGAGAFACIASILRTHYTWKITQSIDISYHTVIIGIWAQVEIATGLVVCCLPVAPRFFQYFGPKIYKTLSFIHKTSQKPDDDPSSAHSTPKRKVIPFYKSQSIKHTLGLNSFPQTWAHPFSTSARLNDDFIVLEQNNTRPPSTTPEETETTDRVRLEHGQHAV